MRVAAARPSVHLGHDRLLERRDEALERALDAQRLLDLASRRATSSSSGSSGSSSKVT